MCHRTLALQLWRLVTNFLFFGNWGIDFLFHMYFLYVSESNRFATCWLAAELSTAVHGATAVLRSCVCVSSRVHAHVMQDSVLSLPGGKLVSQQSRRFSVLLTLWHDTADGTLPSLPVTACLFPNPLRRSSPSGSRGGTCFDSFSAARVDISGHVLMRLLAGCDALAGWL